MELFATCGTGLEVILGQELRDLGMQEVRPLTGGVAFKAGLEQVYAALLWSRVASRVLLIVGRVDATDSDSLYAACVRYPGKTTSSQAPRLPFRRVEPTTSFEIRATRRCARRTPSAIACATCAASVPTSTRSIPTCAFR